MTGVNYAMLSRQLAALMEGVAYPVANLSNAAALLFQELPGLNWVGFYKREGEILTLYPFQGKPACVRIPVGRGVCGTAAAAGKTQRVGNVHRFPGHIACDSASNSEIVIPLWVGECLWGVLDIDSPEFDRFTPEDQSGLEALAAQLSEMLTDRTPS